MRALLLVVVALPLAVAAQDLRPGQYRTTTTTDLPEMAGKPMVEEECVTQKDVDEGLSKIGIEKESGCKVSNMKRSPGKMSYQIACQEGGMKSAGNVSGSMGADAFDFVVEMRGAQTGGKPMRTRIVGKRLGNCK